MTPTPEIPVTQASRTASRVIDGRAVVIVIDGQALHTLNEVGTFVWARADGRSLGSIVDELVADYEVDRERALADVSRFTEHLARIGALDLGETA